MKLIDDSIKKYDKIVIFGHSNPDGDCFGTQVGLKEMIKTKYPNKEVFIVGSGIPKFSPILGKTDVVNDEFIKDSLAIIVDVSDSALVEDKRFSIAKKVIRIDHHIQTVTDDCYFDENKVSCTQIIYEFSKKFNYPLNKKAASGLFVGLVTDSGRFLYNPMNGNTLIEAGNIANEGDLNLREIYDVIYEPSKDEEKVKSYLMTHFKSMDDKLIYCLCPSKLCKKLGVNPHLVASKVNALTSINGCHIWVVASEIDKDLFRVEIRTKAIDAQPVAFKYGGGGHANACGISRCPKKDVKKVLNDLYILIKE